MRKLRIILGLDLIMVFSAVAVEDTGLFDGSDTEISTVTNAPPGKEVKNPKTGWDKEGKGPAETSAKESVTPETQPEEQREAQGESDLPETVDREAPILNLPPVVDHGTNTVEEVPEVEEDPKEKISKPASRTFEPSEQVTAGAAVAFPADI